MGVHRKSILLLLCLAFKNLVYTPDFQLAEVKVDGKTYRCILKDLQFDKVTDELAHLDFLELVEDKKVIATIPIKFTGTAEGVKGGGKLVTKMKSLKDQNFPKYLKEKIEVDLTNLELNGNIRVEDVKDENYRDTEFSTYSDCFSGDDTSVETGRSCSCSRCCSCCTRESRCCKGCCRRRAGKSRTRQEISKLYTFSIARQLPGFFMIRSSVSAYTYSHMDRYLIVGLRQYWY